MIGLKWHLEDKRRFLELQDFFILQAVEEASVDISNSRCLEIMREALLMQGQENARIVFQFSESPIETIFLNALALCFLRNGLPLVLTPPMANTRIQLAGFRHDLARLSDFMMWYRSNHASVSELERYLDEQVSCGCMTTVERPQIAHMILCYQWLPFRHAFHITLQAAFPEVVVDGASVRIDALAWVPSNPDWMVAIECDGFQFHSSQEAFVRDRRKDRAFKSSGVEVHRFSGKEICGDPAGSADALFSYLSDHRPTC